MDQTFMPTSTIAPSSITINLGSLRTEVCGLLGIGGIIGECWQNYKSFCIPVTNEFSFNDPAFPIKHIDIESKLEIDYNFRKKDGDAPFERTASILR